jgi:uncharacterized protein (TIGR02001 family)
MYSKVINAGAAAVALLCCATVSAQDDAKESAHHWTTNVGVFSNYVFRGLTQTNERPAIQGGVDYAHASGAYAGIWLSNVSWFEDTNAGSSSSLEWDGYAGFKKSWDNGLSGDAGLIRYQYPGSYRGLPAGTVEPHTTELYASLGWKWAALKYFYAVTDTFGVEDSDGSDYLDLSVAVPINEQLTAGVHAGRQHFTGASTAARLSGVTNDALYTYEDYRANLTYSFAQGWTGALTYTHTNARDAGYTVLGKNLGDDQLVVGVTRSF